MITDGEIETGATAIKAVADKYGVGSFISEEQRKELAKAVLDAVDNYRQTWGPRVGDANNSGSPVGWGDDVKDPSL